MTRSSSWLSSRANFRANPDPNKCTSHHRWDSGVVAGVQQVMREHRGMHDEQDKIPCLGAMLAFALCVNISVVFNSTDFFPDNIIEFARHQNACDDFAVAKMIVTILNRFLFVLLFGIQGEISPGR